MKVKVINSLTNSVVAVFYGTTFEEANAKAERFIRRIGNNNFRIVGG